MDLIVSRDGDGWQATYGDKRWRCAIGRGGLRAAREKVEGDGASPIGRWPIRRVFYRADRIAQPASPFPVSAIDRLDGWCDAPSHPEYNRQIRLPFAASHEELWMEDDIYDIVVVLGHNDDPPVPGAGSAVFLHIARPGYTPTAGCAALSREDLLAFLALADPSSHLVFSDAA
ncbi:L,D-transpeptidase-like protein [Rhizobium subbaraonis]|uniref:L,D-transpeptidase-like protein n=1 Tax=Rhizobium subbaraonis TaxID=908946 RepID=A0A285U3K1_9HYPH|nr:L,D-transpeptidase family protein [Rhizobium subbaraonis]SOC35998.1 L,D-transpeptidase-like protein [Rhizobium subbaraonis]